MRYHTSNTGWRRLLMKLRVSTYSEKTRAMAVSTIAFVLLMTPTFILGQSQKGDSESVMSQYMDFWVVRVVLNLLGYAVIIVPGYIIIRYVKKSKYLDTAGVGCFPSIVRLCVQEGEPEKASLEEGGKKSDTSANQQNMFQRGCHLMFCATWLLSAYLIWGLVQERIMAYEYGVDEHGQNGERFKNSQFLVFMNRILAFAVAMLVIVCKRQPKHTAPLYKYSYSSFSNIMSSWFQYEALKFVSFPTQVLAKASKVIPVMLMGKIVSKNTYEYYEYVSAVMISIGVTMFILTSPDATKDRGTVTTFSGLILLVGYLLFDAFTSNWQGELFKTYKMSSIQCMAGVNLFSIIFTGTTLLEQGGFVEGISFMLKYPSFMMHIIVLSICSGVGQVGIFYTISAFGAVTFTIIMTLRQGFAILLSCMYYNHPVTMVGIFGVMFVFAAIFIRIYCNQQKRKAKALQAASSSAATSSGKV